MDRCTTVDENLCFAVYGANHAFTAAYKPLLAPLGLTYPQYLVLLVLWEQDDIPVKEIGTRLLLDSGTLTPLLKRMEAAGLLRRTRDTADERQVRIQLTPKGQGLRTEAARVQAAMACVLDEADATLAALRGQLSTLAKRLRAAA